MSYKLSGGGLKMTGLVKTVKMYRLYFLRTIGSSAGAQPPADPSTIARAYDGIDDNVTDHWRAFSLGNWITAEFGVSNPFTGTLNVKWQTLVPNFVNRGRYRMGWVNSKGQTTYIINSNNIVSPAWRQRNDTGQVVDCVMVFITAIDDGGGNPWFRINEISLIE